MISADVSDNQSVDYTRATISFTNNSNSIYIELKYNSEAGKLEGYHTILQDMLNGVWQANFMTYNDHGGNLTESDVSGLSFSVSGARVPDTTPPVVSNIAYSSTSVVPGDTLYVSADIEDESKIGSYAYIQFHQYVSNAIYLEYNETSGKLEGSYQIPQDMINGVWDAFQIDTFDQVGNRSSILITDLSFTVSGGKDPDATPPVVSNIVFSSASVVPGDTLYVSADIEDESKIGSYATLKIKDPLLIQSQIEISLYYNSETDKLEGSYLMTDGMSNGDWVGGWMNIFDSFGNQSRISSNSDLKFTLSGSNEIDYSNLIDNIRFDKTTAKVGDTVKLIIKLKESFTEELEFSLLMNNKEFEVEYVENLKSYVSEIFVDETFINGDYYIYKLGSSRTYDELQNIFFTVEDNTLTEEPIMLTDASISSSYLSPGETLLISVDVENNTEFTPIGIAVVQGPDKFVKSVNLSYNETSKKLEGSLTVDDTYINGEWYIYLLDLGYEYEDYGTVHNFTSSYLYKNNILSDMKFRIENSLQNIDLDPPTILNASVSNKYVNTGDTIKFKFEVNDTSVETIDGYVYLSNSIGQFRYVYLEYNVETGYIEGSLVIDDLMYDGGWSVNDLSFYDGSYSYLNYKDKINLDNLGLNFNVVNINNIKPEIEIESISFSKDLVSAGDYIYVNAKANEQIDDLGFIIEFSGPNGDKRKFNEYFIDSYRGGHDPLRRGFVVDPYMLNGDWYISSFQVSSNEYGFSFYINDPRVLKKAFTVEGNTSTQPDHAFIGVENNKIYNSPQTVDFRNANAIVFRGVSFRYYYEIESGHVFDKEGMYILSVVDRFQNHYEIRFKIDMTVPIVTGIENSKIYTVPVTIGFNEGTVTLNGQAFTSGISVSAAGKYILVVTDKAGNVTTVNFEIANPSPSTPSAQTEPSPITQTTVTNPNISTGSNNQSSQPSYVEKLNDLTEILSDENVNNSVFTNLLKEIFNLNPGFISGLDEVEYKALEDKVLEVYASTLGIRIEGNSELKLEGYSFIDDLAEILKGSRIDVLVQVSEEINSTDQSLIDSYVSKNSLDSSKLYSIDIELFKMINGVEEELTTLKQPVTITLPLPSKFAGVTDFTIIHVHEGIIYELPVIINGDGTFSFTTDKFSSFTLIDAAKLAPVIEEVEQSKNELNWLWGGSLVIMIALAAYFIRKRSKIVG